MCENHRQIPIKNIRAQQGKQKQKFAPENCSQKPALRRRELCQKTAKDENQTAKNTKEKNGQHLSGPKHASQKRSGLKTQFSIRIFVLEFARPLVSKRGFDPQYASVFDRYAASTRSLLDMVRFSFNTKFGKDKSPIKIRPATQNTQRVEISTRNATRRKRSGSGPLRTAFPPFVSGEEPAKKG